MVLGLSEKSLILLSPPSLFVTGTSLNACSSNVETEPL